MPHIFLTSEFANCSLKSVYKGCSFAVCVFATPEAYVAGRELSEGSSDVL